MSRGWRVFRGSPGVSAAYAAVPTLIGLALLAAVGYFGASPMSLVLAGGFMLVAPAMLTGFFELLQMQELGEPVGIAVPFRALAHASGSVWLVAVICAFLFLIWITDAGVLYSFMVGGARSPYKLPWLVELRPKVLAFWAWGALMGSALAFCIFAVSAFSVPLLFERRARLATAVHASARAVFANLVPCVLWGVILTVATVLSIVVLPSLLVVLPVLAYASFALYRRVFPTVGPT